MRRRDRIPTNQSIIINSKLHQKEVNSLFIEIETKSTLTKYNIIVGCIYRPPSYPLHYFNELESEKKICINCKILQL